MSIYCKEGRGLRFSGFFQKPRKSRVLALKVSAGFEPHLPPNKSCTQNKLNKLVVNITMEVLSTPEAYFEWVHQEMRRAYVKKKHPYRIVVLSTFGNEYPKSRNVVLRNYGANRTFEVYTDSRSNKVAELIQHPESSLLFWDSKKNIQVRIATRAEIAHNNSTTEAIWKKLAPRQREEYLKAAPSGKTIESPQEFHNLLEVEMNHFSILQLTPYFWDILHLSAEGHRRVGVRKEAENWTAEWIMP